MPARASRYLPLLLPLWVASCVAASPTSSGNEDKSDTPSSQCVGYADAVTTGRLVDSDADELSGLVMSRSRPGLLWAHNDGNGNRLKLYAIDRNADLRKEFRIHGLDLEDLEDIAMGPGPDPDRDYLYLADTGDNDNNRDEIRIIRLAEPDVETQDEVLDEDVEVFRFRYDDHDPHDAEAIFVDPTSGDVYIVTKHGPDERRTRVYLAQAPLDASSRNTLVEVLRDQDAPDLRGSVVAADISQDGTRIALLFKEEATRIWTREPGQSVREALQGPACHAPSAPGQQEALAFSTESDGFYLIPEGEDPKMSFIAPAKRCPEPLLAEDRGPVLADSLEEASGLVVSLRSPDLLWAINDSGRGLARNAIIAIGRDGTHLGDIALPGIENEDWEDLAIGPGPIAAQSYLYIADIGDNDLERGKVRVHRFLEPSLDESVDEIETFEFEYPHDEPHDAESLFVDPISGDLYIVTRWRPDDTKTRVYRAHAPFDADSKTRLHKVLDEDDNNDLSNAIVAADISADGLILSLARRDGRPLLYHRRPEGPAFEALKYPGCPLQSFAGKHDAIALEPGGDGYFQLPEGTEPRLFHSELRFLGPLP